VFTAFFSPLSRCPTPFVSCFHVLFPGIRCNPCLPVDGLSFSVSPSTSVLCCLLFFFVASYGFLSVLFVFSADGVLVVCAFISWCVLPCAQLCVLCIYVVPFFLCWCVLCWFFCLSFYSAIPVALGYCSPVHFPSSCFLPLSRTSVPFLTGSACSPPSRLHPGQDRPPSLMVPTGHLIPSSFSRDLPSFFTEFPSPYCSPQISEILASVREPFFSSLGPCSFPPPSVNSLPTGHVFRRRCLPQPLISPPTPSPMESRPPGLVFFFTPFLSVFLPDLASFLRLSPMYSHPAPNLLPPFS